MSVFGSIELENGLVFDWWRFASSEEEAVREVTQQHVHVKRCWCWTTGRFGALERDK